jgi:hypothetical protein
MFLCYRLDVDLNIDHFMEHWERNLNQNHQMLPSQKEGYISTAVTACASIKHADRWFWNATIDLHAMGYKYHANGEYANF